MSDWLWYLIVGLATVPIWGTFLWHTFELSIRPRFIPQEEIDRRVADMLTKPNPGEAVFIEEYAAWHRSDTFEQGKWRRVRRDLQKPHQWK